MKHHSPIEQYFKNASPVVSNRPRPPAPFVTISRQAGAGGHELAEALAARLSRETDDVFSGWQIFDKDLCERVAAEPGLRVSLSSLLDEEFHTGLDDMLRSVLGSASPQIEINHHMFRIVRGICAVGKAIVIGRAASLITRDLTSGVHVRLVSKMGARIERVKRARNVDAAQARRLIDEMDERRALMVDALFNKDIEDPLLYDCVWNADTASYETIADSLVPLIRANAKLAPVASNGVPSPG
jgi:cytidylate kinase